MDPWKTQYLQTGPHGILFENSVNGTLIHGRHAGLPGGRPDPAPNSMYQFRNFGMGGQRPNYGHLNDQAYRNSLKSFGLENFKLCWDLGKTPSRNAKLDELLGLIDKDGKPIAATNPALLPRTAAAAWPQTLRPPRTRQRDCVCSAWSPRDKPEDRIPPPPDLVWHTTLCEDPRRDRDRTSSPHSRRPSRLRRGRPGLSDQRRPSRRRGPAQSSRSLGASYGERPKERRSQSQRLPAGLRHERPTVAEHTLSTSGRTPPRPSSPARSSSPLPDGPSLLCLDLHDGRPLWKVNRADGDLYFAGVFEARPSSSIRTRCGPCV